MSDKSHRSFIERALSYPLGFLRRLTATHKTSDKYTGACQVSGSSRSSSENNNRKSEPHHNTHSARWKAIDTVTSLEGNLEMRHFRKIKKIGRGGSGTVFLAELGDTKTYFAVKVVDGKNKCNLWREVQVLKYLQSHPLFPTLFFHCNTERKSYIVTEYCPADLDSLRHIQPGHCFPEEIVRYYCAEILLAMEYLHMLGIVHRDLKPANVLVREDGHLLLADFDVSRDFYVHHVVTQSPNPRHVKKYRLPFFPSKKKKGKTEFVAEPWGGRSHSYVGTREYMAPEIIENKGHGGAVDWWSFGVFVYQLLYGRTPFKGRDSDETHNNVVEQELKFPEFPRVCEEAKDLIKGLLVKQHWKRLGHRTGATEIKKHPFFRGVQWALVLSRPPPNLPKPIIKTPLSNKNKVLHCRW